VYVGMLSFTPTNGEGTNAVRYIDVTDASRVSLVTINGSSALEIDFSLTLDDRNDKQWSVPYPTS